VRTFLVFLFDLAVFFASDLGVVFVADLEVFVFEASLDCEGACAKAWAGKISAAVIRYTKTNKPS
jgi:hypothetical protein